jgi:hypothetical protein
MKVYEIQTEKEGKFNLFDVLGDYLEVDYYQARVYRINIEGKHLVGAFQDWTYALELHPVEKKTPEQ